MNGPPRQPIAQAIDALKQGDRRGGAALLQDELEQSGGSPDALSAVLQVASTIGEIDLAIEASRRMATRGSVEALVAYWGTLASFGRSPEALAEIRRQPVSVREHPSVLYFRATAATEWGRFEEAQELFRRALAKAPAFTPAWLGLAIIKTFRPGDPDLAAMNRLEPQLRQPIVLATLCYAMGKAHEDCGDIDRAFQLYSRGATIRRQQSRFDSDQHNRAANEAIADYTAQSLARLIPSRADDQRSLFVTGLPRSGTTLTEQILRGHSQVVDGGEVNLFGSALLPTLGLRFADALAYQQRSDGDDPWGEIGRDYDRFLDMRFPAPGLVIDKSLGQSLLVGLMLHALPNARIAWLRRSPEDVALSCFKTQFDSGLAWAWSLVDIADFMRTEDRLFEHWRTQFPERILAVPYEEMVRAPAAWAERLQRHFGLEFEEGIEQVSRADRAIGTASVSQVREPISTSRIGYGSVFERHLKPFRDRYYG